jgi:F-type H+-transporting ATPase subunit b
MLDIHLKWLLLLTVNFLGLIYILNILLFKPLLKVFKEREDTVKSSLDAAKEMSDRKDEGLVRMQQELAEARHKAKEVFETMKSEGSQRQKEALSGAEARAAEMLQAAREDLRKEVEKARQALRSDVEKFSDEIVRKLVKA